MLVVQRRIQVQNQFKLRTRLHIEITHFKAKEINLKNHFNNFLGYVTSLLSVQVNV